jgi:Caspase domain/Domain of unknown function (DUF4384)
MFSSGNRVPRFSVKTGLFCLAALLTSAAQAEQYALLVGVSAYPGLKPELQLQGPVNDIPLVKGVLQTKGFAASNIRVLGNGVPGSHADPTRAAILAELASLASKAQRGDYVFLLFGGHGSQQPTRPGKAQAEPDGLDEIFLPMDVGQWDGSVGAVKNAILDTELGAALNAIRSKGAFVWAVFDACHSGNITRGGTDEETRMRRADASALGIPQAALERAQADASQATRGAPAPTSTKKGSLGDAAKDDGKLGGYVYFYAAQTTETTPEKRLPEGHPERRSYGVFSYTLAQVMSNHPGISYRQAAERVLQLYAASNLRAVTPVFEGSAIDAPVFGQRVGEAIRQWPVSVKGNIIDIEAGTLQQFREGAVFAVLPNAAAKDTEVLAYLSAQSVDVSRSRLVPVAYNSKPILQGELPRDAVVRLVDAAMKLELRIALPAEVPSGQRYGAANAMLNALRTQSTEGLKLIWVSAKQPADIRLAFAEEQLWFVPPDGAWIKTGEAKSPSLTLNKSENELRSLVLSTLHSIGKATNLFKIGATGSASSGALMAKLDIRFFVTRAGSPKKEEISGADVPKLAAGDKLQVVVKNNHSLPMDVTVLGVDGRYGISLLYPQSANEANRIHPRDTLVVPGDNEAPIELDGNTVGRESIVVIAVEAPANSASVNLGFLQQAALDATRGQRSEDSPGGDVLDLFSDAGFGGERTRGPTRATAVQKTAIRNFNYFAVSPSK